MPETPALQIDSESMRAIVQKAILDSITPEQKQLVIADAVAYLVARKERPKDRYAGYGAKPEYDPSPLEVAFREAVQEISHEVVKEYLAGDDIRQQVKGALRAQVDRLVDHTDEGNAADKSSSWLSWTLANAFRDHIEFELKSKS